jgi:hypothetical protein
MLVCLDVLQGGSSTPLRHTGDVAMSSLSGTQGTAPAPADDTHDSAFLHQHPADNVERACALDHLRHASDASDAGTVTAAAAAALAAVAAAAAGPEGGNGHNKRSRGAGEEEEPAGFGGPRSLYHRESKWRQQPRLSPATHGGSLALTDAQQRNRCVRSELSHPTLSPCFYPLSCRCRAAFACPALVTNQQ